MQPNEWANFSCTVDCSLYPVEWHKVGHLYSIEDEAIAGMKFNISSNSTCNSENKATYTLQVLATKAFNNSAFYCVAYESCIDCPETECKCGCVGMCYSRPAFLKGKPAKLKVLYLWFPHLFFFHSNHIVEAVATTPHPTPATPHTIQGTLTCYILSYVLTVEQHLIAPFLSRTIIQQHVIYQCNV